MLARLLVAQLRNAQGGSPDSRITLTPEQSHYLTQVLRYKAGTKIQLFDGQGSRGDSAIMLADKRATQVSQPAGLSQQASSPLRIHLLQGLARSDRMDWIIEKATELGVHRITPVMSEQSAIKLSSKRAEQKLLHWQKVSLAACQQCGQDQLPQIESPIHWAQALKKMSESEKSFVLDPHAKYPLASLVDAWAKGNASASLPVTLLTGPESGLSAQEMTSIHAQALCTASLGPRVLRTESAAIVAITILQALAGDLSAPIRD